MWIIMARIDMGEGMDNVFFGPFKDPDYATRWAETELYEMGAIGQSWMLQELADPREYKESWRRGAELDVE